MLGFFATASFAQEQKKVDDKSVQAPETTEVTEQPVKEIEKASPVSNEEVKKAEKFEPEATDKKEAEKSEEVKTEEPAK